MPQMLMHGSGYGVPLPHTTSKDGLFGSQWGCVLQRNQAPLSTHQHQEYNSMKKGEKLARMSAFSASVEATSDSKSLPKKPGAGVHRKKAEADQ